MCQQLCGRVCHMCVVDLFCFFGQTQADITIVAVFVQLETRLKMVQK